MTELAKRIRLTATPMAGAAEYDSHPRCQTTGVLENVNLGFVPWTGERVGAADAAQAAADEAAAGLPPHWMVAADIGAKVAPVHVFATSGE